MGAIGIVGGVGPAAGIDLAAKIFKHTEASRDQDHIDLYLTSTPSIIPDRTEFLLHEGNDPRPGIYECIKKLASLGATAVGVACNTAHSKDIIGKLPPLPEGVVLVNMIQTTCEEISRQYPFGARIGLLATTGTVRTGVYSQYFAELPSFTLICPCQENQQSVHQAIYNSSYGIKATSRPTDKAKALLRKALDELELQECAAVILGCTELPLAVTPEMTRCRLIDPTELEAIALIKAVCPEKLK
ncbi:MAG: amino acid racemase [Sphaerochaetaceae bacterium]